jgi:hypothetical protein
MARIEAALGTEASGPTGVAECACIRTPLGAKRVDLLRPGDLIVTRSGGLQPLLGLRRHRVSRRDLRADPGLAPIRLGPRALGPMMPARALILAPGQRVRVPGHLLDLAPPEPTHGLAAADLPDRLPGATRLCPAEAMVYITLLFARPEILLIDGAMIEAGTPGAVR